MTDEQFVSRVVGCLMIVVVIVCAIALVVFQ